MDFQSFFTLKKSLCKCIVFFTILVYPVLSLVPKYEACVPKSCGNGPEIRYPFWIAHEQESFCGYPNFEISCNEGNPVLTISSDDYIIQDIFYANQSFHVANSAAYDEGCPTPLHNLSLARTPFAISPGYVNFSFFHNCSEKPPPFTYLPGCANSFAISNKEALEGMNFSSKSCDKWVNAPIVSRGDMASLLQMNYTDVLKMGFVLNWTADSCSSCEGSGGRCGFDNKEFVCFCPRGSHSKICPTHDGIHWRLKIIIGAASTGIGILITCLSAYGFRKKTASTCFMQMTKTDQDIEAFIRNNRILLLKRYSFLQVKKMTSSFKHKLGQGGYGSVYKGTLKDGQVVAVKILNTSKGNGQEFINEVASISRTSHVNVVTLLGFCLEGEKRALIYEFMPNGSLEKFINKEDHSEQTQHLGMESLLRISIGIAKGLEYLHRGCNTRIVHFDIKPHNILLDEEFCPKISDFGLAKLCTKKESVVSMLEARGTIGYIAPEVFSRSFGAVSHKSDVYSYGMMIIEMAGGSKRVDVGEGNSSDIYFPHWIYRRLELGSGFQLHSSMSRDESEIARKMIIVGLWCIQTNPSDRPAMSEVGEMLQGSIEALQIPPKPFLSSPPRIPATAGSLSGYDHPIVIVL